MGSKLLSIPTNTNDMWGDHDGNFINNGEFLYIGGTNVAGSNPVAWIPFDSVPVPKGKTITAAVIYWVAYTSGSGTAEFTLGCEAADNPAVPVNNADLLARVQGSVAPQISPVAYIGGTQYSYDVTAQIQEVVNRSGWVHGNRLALLIKDVVQGNTNRRAIASFDYPTYTRPTLNILIPYFIPTLGGVI